MAAASVSTVRTAQRRQFIPAEMLDACAAMTAFAINPYLVDEIALLQGIVFAAYKDIVPIPIS